MGRYASVFERAVEDWSMEPFGILVKSFRGDVDAASRLLVSIRAYNVESLPVWLVVPDEDLPLFTGVAGSDVELLPESVLSSHLVDAPVAGIRPGYINQEIVKLSFWELELAENYLPVDSDAVFLRPFGLNDFMHSADIPYTVFLEDRDLQMDPDYFTTHWQGREQVLREIQRQVGLEDRRLLTCHGHQVLSSTVLRSLKEEFLAPRGWTYAEMLAHGPYEFSWYNFWLQKTGVIPVELREPYFKVVHSEQQHAAMAIRGTTLNDIARGYLGVIINSNFARAWGDLDHTASRAEILATYLSWSDLSAALVAKLRRWMSSLLRRPRA